MPQVGSTAVTIPVALWERVKKLIRDRPDLGYATPTEFVRDAIRRALENDERAK